MGKQLFVPTFDVDACLEQVRECLEIGWTGMGFKTVEFEEAWKDYTGLPYAYFMNSETAALYVGIEILKRELNWADGDEIITTPMTFVSTNHAILINDMKPVFCDIDDSLCMDPDKVEALISDKTRALLYVGMGGNSGRIDKIIEICRKHNIKLLLDAAHMAGSKLNGEVVGKAADVIFYSYQAVKPLPSSDSGMLCFKDEKYDAIARKLSWLGINKDTYSRASDGANYKWKYDVEYVGYKYNGNAVVAAICLAQLNCIERDNAYRRQVSSWYMEEFDKLNLEGLRYIKHVNESESSRHLFQIVTDRRDDLLTYLNSKEVYPGVHYVTNTEYRMYAADKGDLAKADYYSDRILSLPMHLRLTRQDVVEIVGHIAEFMQK